MRKLIEIQTVGPFVREGEGEGEGEDTRAKPGPSLVSLNILTSSAFYADKYKKKQFNIKTEKNL